jgi:nitrite reductase (NADH) large subunit
MKHVIIGAGVAGISAAKTIKQLDKEAEVLVFGEETFLPYRRHLLTEFLCDSIPEDQLFHTSLAWLKESGIILRIGEHVKIIQPAEKTIKLSHNELIHYDKLLIATGARPVLGPVLLPFQAFIQPYHALEDILLLKNKQKEFHHCIVFATGLSSLDLLCGLTNLGKQVTYITKANQANFGLSQEEFNGEVQDFLITKSIKIIHNDQIIRIERENSHFRVFTLKQHELSADIIFAWDSYKPHLECIQGTAIDKKLGILVNLQLKTSVADIYAAGDCIELYHPVIKNYWLNFGWPNALEQGRVAGSNMVGKTEDYQIHKTLAFKLLGKSLKARWWK